MALDGCEYAIAIEDDLSQRDASALDVVTAHDNYHRQGWPTDPTHAHVAVYIALWKAEPATANGSVCGYGTSGNRQYRWATLDDFQCTGQEAGGANPW